MLWYEPNSFLCNGLLVISFQNKCPIIQESVFWFCWKRLCIPYASEKIAWWLISRNWNNDAWTWRYSGWIIWLPVALCIPFHFERSDVRAVVWLRGVLYCLFDCFVIDVDFCDAYLTKNIFELLKCQGVAWSHWAPFSKTLSNKLLNIHLDLGLGLSCCSDVFVEDCSASC